MGRTFSRGVEWDMPATEVDPIERGGLDVSIDPLSESEIKMAIRRMKSDKAAGVDNVGAELLSAFIILPAFSIEDKAFFTLLHFSLYLLPCLSARTGFRHPWVHFSEECERSRGVFRKLKYPNRLIDTVINSLSPRELQRTSPNSISMMSSR